MSIRIESPRQDQVIHLLRQSNEYTLALYPAESAYLLDIDELDAPNVSVFVARLEAEAVGMAALVERGDGTAEIKRMYVTAWARGHGVASDILNALHKHAVLRGITAIQLETGPLQPKAIALYERHGYVRIPNFGQYVGDEFSLCFEKRLG
jgi:putative acetyltransferase